MSQLSQDRTKNRKHITMSNHVRLPHCWAELSSQGAEFSGWMGPRSPADVAEFSGWWGRVLRGAKFSGADFSAGPTSPDTTDSTSSWDKIEVAPLVPMPWVLLSSVGCDLVSRVHCPENWNPGYQSYQHNIKYRQAEAWWKTYIWRSNCKVVIKQCS